MTKKVLIIGGGDAGTYTLEAIFKKGAEVLKQFDITLLKKEKGVYLCSTFCLTGYI
jgi:NADH dehydrogenase FAD-containing subunit